MVSTEKDTEAKILDAAKQVFFQQGSKVATMQSIADVAGINRTLLNYYFRTKEKLYEKVLIETLTQRTIRLGETLGQAEDIAEFIDLMVDYYCDYNLFSPEYPNFYVRAINEAPSKILALLENNSRKKHPLLQIDELVQKAITEGKIRQVDSEHLFWIINSCCNYPFLIKSLIYAYNGRSEKQFHSRVIMFKEEVKTLVWNGIKQN